MVLKYILFYKDRKNIDCQALVNSLHVKDYAIPVDSYLNWKSRLTWVKH